MRVVTVEGEWRGGRGRGSWQEWRPPPVLWLKPHGRTQMASSERHPPVHSLLFPLSEPWLSPSSRRDCPPQRPVDARSDGHRRANP